MIDIKQLKRNDRLWKVYPNGDIAIFVVWDVQYDIATGWWAHIDWADDDYYKIIHECDQENFYYGEGYLDT